RRSAGSGQGRRDRLRRSDARQRPWSRRLDRRRRDRGVREAGQAMNRRAFLAAIGAAGVAAAAAAQTPAPAPRKGRLKQAAMRFNFGRDTTLTFDDMCREAARAGYRGFDLVGPQDWPTLKKHGLVCTMAPAMGVTIRDGLIRPELHDAIEKAMRSEIDLCAE